DAVLPMSAAANSLPPLSKSFIQMGPQGALSATKLLSPFSDIFDSLELKNPFVHLRVSVAVVVLFIGILLTMDYLGILSDVTVFMFAEWYKPRCKLEHFLHGSGGVVDSLVRGMQKFGGMLSLGSHVENIVVEKGRSVGVRLRSGQ
ncbi:hypothetical protein IFM89_022061, partial [Coptis chinensis]